MSGYTLCVIDMQYYFGNSHHCLRGVLDEVEYAILNNNTILIVEYWMNSLAGTHKLGSTNSEILNLLEGYKNKYFIPKYTDGGGHEIFNAAKKHKFSVDKIRMVGVNRSFCVAATAFELLYLQKEANQSGIIEVVREATWCDNPKFGIEKLRNMGAMIVNSVKSCDPDEEELTEEEIRQNKIEWEINRQENEEDWANAW